MHTLFKFSHCPTQDCLLVHHWTILSSAVIFKSLHGSLLWLLALTHLRMCTGFPPACRNSDLVLEFQLGENDIVSYSEMNHVSRAGRDQNLLHTTEEWNMPTVQFVAPNIPFSKADPPFSF